MSIGSIRTIDLNLIGVAIICIRTLAPDDEVSPQSTITGKGDMSLHRDTGERMSNSDQIPFREVHRRSKRRTTEQELHCAFGK